MQDLLKDALASLDAHLLSDPSHETILFAQAHRRGLDGFSLVVDYGVNPFVTERDEYTVSLTFFGGFSQSERERAVSQVRLSAMEWCKRLHGFAGCDDDEPDFYSRVNFEQIGDSFAFAVPGQGEEVAA